jgi:hypothetical protein
MSTVTAISFKPKATRKRLKKEILSDDLRNGNFSGKIMRKIFRTGKFSTSHHYLCVIKIPQYKEGQSSDMGCSAIGKKYSL